MYARETTFISSPEHRPELEQFADQVFALLRGLDGFVSAHFLVDPDEREFGYFTLWESRQNADAAGAIMHEEAKDMLSRFAVEPPVNKTFEIYKPRV